LPLELTSSAGGDNCDILWEWPSNKLLAILIVAVLCNSSVLGIFSCWIAWLWSWEWTDFYMSNVFRKNCFNQIQEFTLFCR
jgi:hypothetical protein